LEAPVEPQDVVRLIEWVKSTDLLIQFAPSNGSSVQNEFDATAGEAHDVELWVTNGQGFLDVFNSDEEVTVGASGGTVNGETSVDVTMEDGKVVLSVLRATAGDVTLSLSNNTRLNINDTAVVHFA
jgi:hypothetical protein